MPTAAFNFLRAFSVLPFEPGFLLEEDVVVVVIVVVVVVVVVVKYLNIDEADVDRDQVTSRFSPLRFSSLYCSVTRTPSPGHTVFSTTR